MGHPESIEGVALSASQEWLSLRDGIETTEWHPDYAMLRLPVPQCMIYSPQETAKCDKETIREKYVVIMSTLCR